MASGDDSAVGEEVPPLGHAVQLVLAAFLEDIPEPVSRNVTVWIASACDGPASVLIGEPITTATPSGGAVVLVHEAMRVPASPSSVARSVDPTISAKSTVPTAMYATDTCGPRSRSSRRISHRATLSAGWIGRSRPLR